MTHHKIKQIIKARKKETEQKRIAKKLKITDAYVSMLLSGKRKSPVLLKKIHELLMLINNK